VIHKRIPSFPLVEAARPGIGPDGKEKDDAKRDLLNAAIIP
jgi:hypothetical protein